MKYQLKRVSEIIPIDEIRKWNKDIVTVSAGCGAGKSYFVKNILYEIAKEKGKKILMLIHRSNPVDQFIDELERDGKTKYIDVLTYQSIENTLTEKGSYDYSDYMYIVADEFHYFTSDSTFNISTDLSFYSIFNQTKATRIFMSATGDEMMGVLKSEMDRQNIKKKIKQYRVQPSFRHIRSLTFFFDKEDISDLINRWLLTNDKAIIFLNDSKLAYKLYTKYKDISLFLCSKSNPLYKKVDKEKIEQMLKREKFEEKFLITTSCFDAGANINDTDVTKIVADIRDIDSLIQCLGRKRIKDQNDKIDVYIKALTPKQMSYEVHRLGSILERVDYLRNTSPEEYVEKYGRVPDDNKIVYESVVEKYNKKRIVLNINELKYHKLCYDKKRYETILTWNSVCRKFCYCKYIAGYLRFKGNSKHYRVYTKDSPIELYLYSISGKPLHTADEKKPLIDKIDVRSNGKQLKRLSSLNAALCERGIPYAIEEFDDTSDGKRYRHTWRVVPVND